MLEGNLASFLSLEFRIFLYLPIHPSWANYRRRIDIYVKKMPIREGSCMLCGWPMEDLQMPLLLPTLVLVPLLGKALAIAIDRDLWQMWVWSCSPLACFIDHTQISADFFRNQQWWCKLSICQLFCTVKHCWSVLEDARWRLSQASDVFLCTSILSACLALPFFEPRRSSWLSGSLGTFYVTLPFFFCCFRRLAVSLPFTLWKHLCCSTSWISGPRSSKHGSDRVSIPRPIWILSIPSKPFSPWPATASSSA